MYPTTNSADLLTQTESYVETYLRKNIDPRYVYHNFQHTVAVVEAAEELAQDYDLSESDLLALRLAGWFHDTGYAGGYAGHEERSAELARDFLHSNGIDDPGLFAAIRGAIMATGMPQRPQSLLEELLADADLSHLGDVSYWDRCGRVRQEFALTRDMVMSDQQWIDFELAFMLDHEYHTEAARERYGPLKGKHVKQLYKRKKALLPDATPSTLAEFKQDKKNKKKRSRSKKDPGNRDPDLKPGRGVETMYRTTYRTHINLSSIADNKANIMLSVNAIILSISAANLFPKLDSNPHLTLPSIILVGVCLGSLYYAIQATRPKVTEGNTGLEDIQNRQSNLLFFGNFYNMKLDDFHFGMMEMIRDEEFLYSSMTRDLYFLGVVLAKKYMYLRICYNVFLYGIILAVAAFIAASLYDNHQHGAAQVFDLFN
ncbi:Pycsar system effector family protein [Lewinella sp. IMCC34183]|uniref:Pycsar system effector family protein n=1 Tax=Lewinella sp. IMCC34183 TaxID=2248762 RepID=UPI000E288FC9|nr:Pycsar system effector family protein [Lewinella sp. IMCC34183]